MENLNVNYKKLHDHAFEPEYSTDGSAGMDLRAIDYYYNSEFDFVEYGTGLAFKIPEGYVGLLFARSSVSKSPHILANCVGVVDSDYTGEVKFRFKNINGPKDTFSYSFSDKIGQLLIIPYPKINLNLVSELQETNRGSGGFGSTGR